MNLDDTRLRAHLRFHVGDHILKSSETAAHGLVATRAAASGFLLGPVGIWGVLATSSFVSSNTRIARQLPVALQSTCESATTNAHSHRKSARCRPLPVSQCSLSDPAGLAGLGRPVPFLDPYVGHDVYRFFDRIIPLSTILCALRSSCTYDVVESRNCCGMEIKTPLLQLMHVTLLLRKLCARR